MVNVHGLRGEVRVEMHTDFPQRFAVGNQLLRGPGLEPAHIDTSRPHKGFMLIRFDGMNTREQAEEIRGHWLFVPEEDAHSLADDTYWIHDLVGLQVSTESGTMLGTIRDVLVTGANDVYVIQTQAPFNQGRDLLVPAAGDVVQQVDLDAGAMVVRLPDGLIEST